MNRFTLIVLTALLMILLIVILYFSLSTLFAKIKNAIFNIKIKKIIIAVTESFDNLSHGKFPQSETIEFICLNINKDKAMKDLFYKKAEEVLTDTDHETITRKFMDEINNKINKEEIKQITVDHSLVSHMVASGEITKEEAEHHPNRNIITNALGTQEEFFIDTYDLELEKGDIVLICSDGLSEHVTNEEIMEIVNNNDLDEAKHLLIDKANENGGTDNVTVVLFDGGIE